MPQMSKQQWELLCPRCGKEKKLDSKLCPECEKRCCKVCGDYIEDESGICKKCLDDFTQEKMRKRVETLAASPSRVAPEIATKAPKPNEGALLFCFLILFLVPAFYSIMSVLDLYLFSMLASLISIAVGLIISCAFSFIVISTRSILSFSIIVGVLALACYFSVRHVGEYKQVAQQKQEEKAQQDEILRQNYRDAPYRCNEIQREQAKSDLELIINNGVAERNVDAGWIIYSWRINWWFLNEQEQQASIRKVADIEACFSKEGYALPSVIINYTGEDVAKADGREGLRILKSRP